MPYQQTSDVEDAHALKYVATCVNYS